MPAGIKPLEKFLKKQTSALSRAGGFGEKGGSGGPRRRSSVSRVLPFFRDLSPESAQPPQEVFSPDADEAPSWPPGSGAAAAASSSSSRSDSRSPSLSSDEQCAPEGSLETPTATAAWGGPPLAPDTPENLVLALLDGVTGSKRQGGNSAEILLDDFMLTHPIFLSADKLQQVLLQEYPSHNATPRPDACHSEGGGGTSGFRADRKSHEGWRGFDTADRKQAVLSVAFRYLETYRHLLQEEGEKSQVFPKTSCSRSSCRSILPTMPHPALTHVTAREGAGLPVFCRVYTPDHSYVTIRSPLSSSVQEILALVSEKLQYSGEQEEQQGAMVLVAVTSSGEKAVFRPSEDSVFTTLGVNTHLFVCEPARLGTLVPLPEEIHWSPGDSRLHDMSAEEVANQLLAFDWELFSCVHEVEFVRYVFRGEEARWRPLNLELVLQRCSEVQHWVGTEILQCQSLPKRGQLLRKFIKIAALCKQNQDLLSFFSVVLGLNNPALSRLRHTWESYRDLLSSLRAPVIPFTPLLLKALDTDSSPSYLQAKAFVRQLQVIDNQNLLFNMSYKLEPKDT
ncbi:UNVERIFIED_CONTAM: hypothetical protein FKN15_006344 [Acipenser sinensis]